MVFRFCYNQSNNILFFLYSGISKSFDESEDDKFRGY